MRKLIMFSLLLFIPGVVWSLPYPVVDTGLKDCFSNRYKITCPDKGGAFFGQDGNFSGNQPKYKDNKDGTVTDLITGLTWVKARGKKVNWDDAMNEVKHFRLGGYDDWRVPTIKELYSLIRFNAGHHPAGGSIPYIDTNYFEFKYGDTFSGEREIDAQDWSATKYVGLTMKGNETVFGVNFADGRIKGYPKFTRREGRKRLYVRYVRGNTNYGKNDFKDHRNGIIEDKATGLMWSKYDSDKGMDWETALRWVDIKNSENYLGHSDWRLPNAKELQTLVDYTKAPKAVSYMNRGPAISELFEISRLKDGSYPFFWTSTTHLDGPKDRLGTAAVYIAFGQATGWMSENSKTDNRDSKNTEMGQSGGTGQRPSMGGGMGQGRSGRGRPGMGGGSGMAMGQSGGGPEMGATDEKRRPTRVGVNKKLLDVHGAGAQRSDPKTGDPQRFSQGRGPQGDVVRIYNYVRLVRDAN